MRFLPTLCIAVALSCAGVETAAETIDAVIPFGRLAHLITVETRINGSTEPFLFAVDTGGLTFLDKEIADRLDLKQRGMMAKIDRLDLEGCAIEKVFVVTAFDFSHFASLSRPVHGIIGSDLLDRFIVTFDFEAETIVLSSDTVAVERPDDAIVLPFRNHPVNFAPVVSMRIGTRDTEGMIDTGQPYPLVLPLSSYDDHVSSFDSKPVVSSGLMEEWPNTRADHNNLVRLGSIETGGRVFEDVLCLFGELPAPLSMPLVGTGFLSRFTVTIDYPRDEMFLVSRGEVDVPGAIFTTGLNIDVDDAGRIVVKGVWAGSPANEAGVESGDVIAAFEGATASNANSIELIELLENDRVTSVALELDRGGTSSIMTLRKIRMP